MFNHVLPVSDLLQLDFPNTILLVFFCLCIKLHYCHVCRYLGALLCPPSLYHSVLTAFFSRMVVRDADYRVISPTARATESIGKCWDGLNTTLLDRHGTIPMYACYSVWPFPIWFSRFRATEKCARPTVSTQLLSQTRRGNDTNPCKWGVPESPTSFPNII